MSLFPEIDNEIEDIKKIELEKIKELKSKSIPYVPSNGTDGMMFESTFCSTCSKDDSDKNIFCKYLGELISGDNCSEIIRYKSKIMCLKHDDFNIKSYLGVEL
jgi:hypothetical protein